MNAGDVYHRSSRPVKAAATVYGERMLENHHSLKKPPQIYSEKPSPLTREPKFAMGETIKYNGSRSNRKPAEPQAESELLVANHTVKDLTSRIEGSNSRAKEQIQYLEKLTKTKKVEGGWGRNMENHRYPQLMAELKDVKQELKKLKEEMASLLEEKRKAEKETEASNSKLGSYSSTVVALKREIEETNEEQVLVELARMEALKEHGAIESEGKKEAERHSAAMEETRKKIEEMTQEIDAAKEIERKLAITTSDVKMLESELKQVKKMGTVNRGKETMRNSECSSQDGHVSSTPELLKSITKELEETKKELASVREEGFKFMASMDIVRTELKNVKEEAARSKKREEKTDLTVQNLNAKLLRGKAKLEAASAAEEKAKEIVSNLSRALEQMKTEAEAAKKERSLIDEETGNIKAEIEKTESEIDLAEERLQAAIEELKSAKSSEAAALGKLKTLIDNTVRRRASVSQRSPVIMISSFEYEYLRNRAAGAEEIADKKVAAAQAWIEALKASEREILIKLEKTKKEIRELKVEEDQEADNTQESLHEKLKVESEFKSWKQKYEKIIAPETPRPQAGLPAKLTNRSGRTTPMRRAKLRKAASPAPRSTPRSASFAVRRRKKVMPNLAKFFSGKSTNKGIEAH
ncbi:protein PLASTID MOVEMENT IMPAIRED 2-like isoform X1 [Coffea arabica]|uniref:Protein PLASTID MOVEMENT IMPAIRED 2-like isoform X1 n=2 Tax=Coffea arabica TaxID=13443 RepID=A0A6P6TNH6_COFAR|nr:protein PLASTID MOVEMENT IMPAIRED 2-like isoform X1 [Coffea arabica]